MNAEAMTDMVGSNQSLEMVCRCWKMTRIVAAVVKFG